MSFTVDKLEKNMVKLTIEVDAEEFAKGMEAAYEKNKNKISVPGFRKGKVPKQMIEKMYGAGIFYEDAANAIIPKEYQRAAVESGLDIVSQPEIDVTQIEEGKNFIFTATVAVRPEVTLGTYKGVEIAKVSTEVTDEDLEAEIKKVQEQNARIINVEDRPVQDKDDTVIDFEGFMNGVPFAGGKGENYSLTIGSHSFIDTFEEQLIGKKIGEETEVNVTFPEHYQAENLAGKPAVFKCKLHEIKGKELPNVDDEFVKDVSEFDTLDEYKADIKSKLEKTAADEASTNLDNALVDAIIGKMKAEVPQVMYQRRIDEIVREWSARNRISVEDYLKYTGVTMDQFRANFTEVAKRQVDLRLALEKIAELENITVSDEDVEKEYADMAEQYKMDVDKIKAAVPADAIKNDLKIEKALDLVRDSAKIEEVTE